MTKNMHETEACMLQSKSLKRCDGWEKGKHKSCVCQFRVFSAPATTRYFCVRSQLRFLPSRGIQLDRAAVCYFSSHHCTAISSCWCFSTKHFLSSQGGNKKAAVFFDPNWYFLLKYLRPTFKVFNVSIKYYVDILDFMTMSIFQEYCVRNVFLDDEQFHAHGYAKSSILHSWILRIFLPWKNCWYDDEDAERRSGEKIVM